MTRTTALDEFLAKSKKASDRASYDTRGKETDPVTDRVLREAEDRKNCADRLLSGPVSLTPSAKVAAVVDKLERKYQDLER